MRYYKLLNFNNLNYKSGAIAPLLATLALSSGCPIGAAPAPAASSTPSTSTDSSATSATSSSAGATTSSGPKAIRVIFKQAYPTGSFDTSPTGGTPAKVGSGQSAVRYFNPDGSLMTSTSTSWLSSFEIGISGSNNLSALNPACARFADAAESSATSNCNFSSGAIGCGAPSALYRVSEYDCMSTAGQPTAVGTGSASDGVYLRATFNRGLLGSGENIMVAFEYVAAAYNAAPASPTTCFSDGVPKPEKCSNVAWKAFLKHSTGESVQPFLLLMPPVENYVVTDTGTSGASPRMRQFVLPLAADPKLQVLQISRIHSNLDPVAAKSTCNAQSAVAANSPLCAGVVLYSMTFYRI